MTPVATKLINNYEEINNNFINSAIKFDQMEDKECRHSIVFPTITLWFDKHSKKTNEQSMREVLSKIDFSTFNHENKVIETWAWMKFRGYNTDIKVNKNFGFMFTGLFKFIGNYFAVKSKMKELMNG